jgi:hypothetical protein
MNIHVPTGDNIYDVKDSYQELKRAFDKFPKYRMKILSDFSAKVSKEFIFKPTIGNESLHRFSIHNGIIVIHFATSKNLTVKSTMYIHRNVYQFSWISPDVMERHIKIGHILIDRRWYSSLLNA